MKKVHETAEVFLRDAEKDVFQIASDIKSALLELNRKLDPESQSEPQFTLVPDAYAKRFKVSFEIDGVKRVMTVHMDYEDSPDENHKLRLSLGAWGQARETLNACAEKITPCYGFLYSNPRDFPKPVQVFVEA